MKRRIIITGILAFVVLQGMVAEDGFSFQVGGGLFMTNTYPGSDKSDFALMPIAKLEYARGPFSLSLSLLDGIGLNYIDMDKRIIGGITINAGEERLSDSYSAGFFDKNHSPSIQRRLEGTANLVTPVYGEILVGYISPIGIVGANLTYHPITATKERETFYNAFTASPFYLIPLPLTDNCTITGMLALDFMENSYAKAWYTVPDHGTELSAFHAQGGIKDIQLFLQLDYMFTKHVGASFLAGNVWLLGDAAESPITASAYQLSSGVYAFVKF